MNGQIAESDLISAWKEGTRLRSLGVLAVSLAAVVLLAHASFAQTVSLNSATNYAVGASPFSVAIGDLNGDGKPDLAAANSSSNTVSILLGIGAGSFGAAIDFAAGLGPVSVAIGDLNGDGKPDLAVVNQNSSDVSIFLGTGTGSFGAVTSFAVGQEFFQASPFSVAIGDLNGDGKPDLAVTLQNSNKVSILLGTGTGSFGAPTNFAVGTQPLILAISDLNGDGNPDLAVANQSSNTVSILLGTGTGSFNSATNFPAGLGPFSVAIGDLNGDGKRDLAVTNRFSNNKVSILVGTGTGSFGGPTSFTVGTSPFGVAIGDLDTDGKPDLAVANAASNNVSILLGTATGSFGAAANFAVGTVPASVAIGDLNGDGKLDLAVANIGSNNVSILLNTVSNQPPTAHAGADFSVNEGQSGVMLNGSGSDPDNDPLTYQWEQVVDGNPLVALSGANTAQPTFTAPGVASGGETLTFTLTVTANGESATDAVSVTVVNLNHPPVAEAGNDQSVTEGSPVSLHGGASFDIDSDTFTYAWAQVNGSPAVTLTGADTASPSFTAPYVATNGAPGVVATLVFELRVDDGFPQDVPAPGYTFANVVNTVTVKITNVDNAPTASAGVDQTVDEQSAVTLNAGGSSDPDSDTLTFAWAQVGGPTLTLSDAATAQAELHRTLREPWGH